MLSNTSVSIRCAVKKIWGETNFLAAQAQEQDALSDADFESDDEDLNDALIKEGSASSSEDEANSNRPAKKQRR